MKKFTFIFFILCFQFVYCFCQNDKWADCRPNIKEYIIYLQPKSIPVPLNETVSIVVVFDGKRDYFLSFCTNKVYYPIHVKLLRSGTRETIYDNVTDDYQESIGMKFNNTQSLIIEISLLASKLSAKERKHNDIVYVGMFMHMKKNTFKLSR